MSARTPPDTDLLRSRHLSSEHLLGLTLYEGHVLADLSAACDEIDRLRACLASEPVTEATVHRARVVAWMRDVADQYASHAELVGTGLSNVWRTVALLVENREPERWTRELPEEA
jgi:hypothetical protein